MASTPYLVDSRQVWCAYNGSGSVYACNGITQPTVIRLVRMSIFGW